MRGERREERREKRVKRLLPEQTVSERGDMRETLQRAVHVTAVA